MDIHQENCFNFFIFTEARINHLLDLLRFYTARYSMICGSQIFLRRNIIFLYQPIPPENFIAAQLFEERSKREFCPLEHFYLQTGARIPAFRFIFDIQGQSYG